MSTQTNHNPAVAAVSARLNRAYVALRNIHSVADLMVLAAEQNNGAPALLDGTFSGIAEARLTLSKDGIQAFEERQNPGTEEDEIDDLKQSTEDAKVDKLDELIKLQRAIATGRRVQSEMLADSVSLHAAISAEIEAGTRPAEHAAKVQSIIDVIGGGAVTAEEVLS